MKTRNLLVLLGSLVVLAGFTGCEPVPVVETGLLGREAPDFRLVTTQGVETSLDELRGAKVTLLDFWATWCAPCIAELPNLQALANKYRHRGLAVVGILCDDNVETVGPPFVERTGLTYPNLLGTEAVQSAYGIQVFPTLLLLDAEGKVIQFNQGPLSHDDLKRWVEGALGEEA